jgi:hypothetical protein
MHAVITTFPNNAWNVYAEEMLKSFVKYWPQEIPLLVQLDDATLEAQVKKILRPIDAVAVGWEKPHFDFVSRNQSKDDPNNYRHQTTRFCHKVFAIKRARDAIEKQKAENLDAPRYLIWMDADVITNRPISMEDIQKCLPDGAVSYLGRKDWPHSECGWLAFDMENEGGVFIDVWHGLYVSDEILKLLETHDSWAFDYVKNSKDAPKTTNLTEGKPGMDIWPHSPMGEWSTHFKGPANKQKMGNMSGIQIQTKNSIPNEQIHSHIKENQSLIKNWIMECELNDEEIVVVSAGPQMIPEDVLEDYNSGKKIIAVKHALGPLERAGIKPWGCILLDPRPHVLDFVDDPDKDVLWFVASQVDPKVTMKLLAHGCEVWGYHAAVGAEEGLLTSLQPHSVVSGGSATATRGLYVLRHLGFHNFKLFGYDLCFPDKPDMNKLDEIGQPKYLEITVSWNDPQSNLKKCFWTEPQLIAQFEEIRTLIDTNTFKMTAVGDGIIPFVLKSKRVGELRRAKLKATIKPIQYGKLLKWNKTKKTRFSTKLLNKLLNYLKKN